MISRTIIKNIDDDDCLRYKCHLGEFILYDRAYNYIEHILSCRDEFGWEWNDDSPNRWVGFLTGNPINIARVHRVWMRIERKLGLNVKSIFYKTDTPAIIIKVSPFWIKTETSRSVFTLLLRMVVCYDAPTLGQMMEKYPLARNCAPALKWFLKGNTKPTYDRWNEKSIQELYIKI